MTFPSPQLRLIAVALAAIAIAAGAAAPRAESTANDRSAPQSGKRSATRPAERVWPEAPAQGRVRFVASLAPQTSVKRSFFRKMWRAVSGGGDVPVMTQPYGIAMGPLGRLYVADTAGHAVHAYDVREGGYSKINVESESLIGVAALGGRLFVTDSVAGRVICLNGAGRKQWATGPEAGLQRPTGIVAADDRLHVVDTVAHRIVTLSPEGRVLGSFGSRGAEPGQFNYPTNIARDEQGQLYVTDSMNFRIQIFTPQGRYISSFGQLGDGSGDFNRPKGVAVDSDGHIYVVEGLHDVVQIFDREGRFLLSFAEPGHGDGELWLATGIAIVKDRIYVADSSNRRVQVFEYLKEEQ
jgi:DNA-binding beta-propeller fold protein YncE